MGHSPFNPNLNVEYGNMIHFAENAWTSEGRLNVGRIHHQIGQNGLSVFKHLQQNESYFHNLHINWV